MGTLCTRTLYTHPEPCPPPTYFNFKTFLANFRVLREREIWSGISGWETESGQKKCPNAKSGFPRDRPETIIKNVSGLSRGKPLFCVWAFFARIPFPIPLPHNHFTINKNALNECIFFFIFLVYRRQVGIGEVWHEVDSYLLDNRNRTQKWDE